MKKILILILMISILLIGGCAANLKNEVLIESAEELSEEQLQNSLGTIINRLNYYGFDSKGIIKGEDIIIKASDELIDHKDILEEILKQNRFEARIGDEVVYAANDVEINFSRTNQLCGIKEGTYKCQFMIVAVLSKGAAEKHAELTNKLEEVEADGFSYLSKTFDYYLDEQKIESLKISSELKGIEVSEIAISRADFGETIKEAKENSVKNVKLMLASIEFGELDSNFNIMDITKI